MLSQPASCLSPLPTGLKFMPTDLVFVPFVKSILANTTDLTTICNQIVRFKLQTRPKSVCEIYPWSVQVFSDTA